MDYSDKELQELGAMMTAARNRTGIEDFEGYSPVEMNTIIHNPFSDDCPLQLKTLTSEIVNHSPLFQMIYYLLDTIRQEKELKLTTKGNLPVKVTNDLYKQNFISDYWIDFRKPKQVRQGDSEVINLAMILLTISNWVKKRNNKLSLTKNGEKLLDLPDKLFRQLFELFTGKFSWAYMDGYNSREAGQMGWAFSIILLSRYGEKERTHDFYAEKYFKAWPMLIDNFHDDFYRGKAETAHSCYAIRTIVRFSDFFGFTKTVQSYKEGEDRYKIIATDLLNQVFEIRRPAFGLATGN
ncbi:MAG: hypothetical protein HN686_17250 [Bacteroidetes bacterium]|nr:hypothetical protein [Bacteroidota bacterium]